MAQIKRKLNTITIDEPQAKRANYSEKSLQMMKKWGFTGETGLGKKGQGRLEPVEASTQNGRRGFGLKLDGLEMAATKWTSGMENIQLRETVNFISDYSDDLKTKSYGDLSAWMVAGLKKFTIEEETQFCCADVLKNVLASKSVFDQLGTENMNSARGRCNPFETIGSSIFMNRAAVKMANMDAVCDFMFTNPVDEKGIPLVKEDELLYFADVCAGPGGFSEYVLWRKQWEAKGFGFTLKSENDFKLDKFLAGNPETFDTYYGVKGDGNVYDPENIESFTDYVRKQTPVGVHLMMSDGGFSVEGQENVQEILSKQLYLCQCLTALSIVRDDGHFVTKVFDLFTSFSVGLIYLMYKCFKKISIIKPNTSRPANSERYLVCKWKKPNTDAIRRYLFKVNMQLFQNQNTNSDIAELVPFEVIKKDEIFYNYICQSNNIIGKNQVIALHKIAHFSEHTNLRESQQQQQCKNDSLSLWQVPNVPNKMRKAPIKPSTDQIIKALMGNWYPERRSLLESVERCLTLETNFHGTFFNKSDWAFVPIDVVENSCKTIRTFFMSKGNSDVFKYTENGSWERLTEIVVEITPNTLFYGEIVKELKGESKGQTHTYAMHIIDGIVLGGKDIRNFGLQKRNRLCHQFAESLNKPQKEITIVRDNVVHKNTAAIRCKPLYPFDDIRDFFDGLTKHKLKDGKERYGYPVGDLTNPNRFCVPRGILFFKILKPNLCKQWSPQLNDFYYTDMNTKPNTNFLLKEIQNVDMIYGSFRSTYQHRKLWKWEDPGQVDENDNEGRIRNLLYRSDFVDFVFFNIPPSIH